MISSNTNLDLGMSRLENENKNSLTLENFFLQISLMKICMVLDGKNQYRNGKFQEIREHHIYNQFVKTRVFNPIIGDFENFLVENQHFFRVIYQKILRFLAIILMLKLWSKVDLKPRKIEKIHRKFQ